MSAIAATLYAHGYTVRLRPILDAAIDHAYDTLLVPPWVVRLRVRKAGGNRARALILMILSRFGVDARPAAAALGVDTPGLGGNHWL